MEYFVKHINSKNYLSTYNNSKIIHCENEYQKYRCNKYNREWYIDMKRHRRNGPATIWYIGGKVATVEWYINGYRGNTQNDINMVNYFVNGDPMAIHLKYGVADMPSLIEYYKNGNPHFISFENGYDTSRSDGLEFIYYYESGEIAHVGYINRLDDLIAIQILYQPEHIVVYTYSPSHPLGLRAIKIYGNTTVYEYSDREDRLYRETFIDDKLETVEYYENISDESDAEN